MDEDPSYFSPSSDEGIITPSHYYKTSTMKAKINYIHVKIDDMDLDQPLSTRDPSSPGQASHSSLPRDQLPRHVHKARYVWITFTQMCVCERRVQVQE